MVWLLPGCVSSGPAAAGTSGVWRRGSATTLMGGPGGTCCAVGAVMCPGTARLRSWRSAGTGGGPSWSAMWLPGPAAAAVTLSGVSGLRPVGRRQIGAVIG